MRKIKLGWKRNLIKAFQLSSVFFAGLLIWGFASSILDTEPSNITFLPIGLIGVSYFFLALYHRRIDTKMMIEKLSKETGIDVSKIAEEISEENRKK